MISRTEHVQLGSTAYLSLAYFSWMAGCGDDAASENNAITSLRQEVRLQGVYPVTADSLSHCNNNIGHNTVCRHAMANRSN